MGGMSTSWGSSNRYKWDDDDKTTRKSAKDYAKQDKRDYTGSSSTGIKPPVGQDIQTDSKLAAILMVDVTGSMDYWPSLIFQKIPTFYAESNAIMQGISLDKLKKGQKLEDKLEMAVIAVGDARGDNHPIQVVDFSKGSDLVKGVNKIYPEGGGGGNAKESYDLAAYYILNHCKTPKVPKGVKPLIVIAGDEGLYDDVHADWVKELVGDKLPSDLDTKTMMKELTSKYDVYLLRPETGAYYPEMYAKIHKQWQEVLGHEKVLKMTDPNRLVDTFIAICGYASDNYKNSMDMLERRQIDPKNPDEGLEKVEEVLNTLHPLVGKDFVDKEKKRLKKKYKEKPKK